MPVLLLYTKLVLCEKENKRGKNTPRGKTQGKHNPAFRLSRYFLTVGEESNFI